MQSACAILSYVKCPALQYFYTLYHKRHDFRKTESLNIKCVFWLLLQILSETFLILRSNERDVITNGYWSSDFKETRIFSIDFRKILKYQISLNPSSSRLVFHAGGRTDGQI